MAVKISQLTASNPITSDDFFPVVDSGSLTTLRASAQQILNYVTGSTFNTLTVTNLTSSNIDATTAVFSVVSASIVSASSYVGPIGGGGTPGGTDTTIQFNSGSTFSGSSNLTWNYTSNVLSITGSLAATTKSFDIVHPLNSSMRLRYGSLEGPENGVYVRGKTKEKVIQLPEYWINLVDETTITVNLTPVGSHQQLWVEKVENNTVVIGGELVECYFTVFAERKDVDKLVVEY